jgi:hypothetical protein
MIEYSAKYRVGEVKNIHNTVRAKCESKGPFRRRKGKRETDIKVHMRQNKRFGLNSCVSETHGDLL